MKSAKKAKKGFTLIELVVVIAILAVLAVITLPRLTALQQNANKKAIVSNLKMINNAAVVYSVNQGVNLDTIDAAATLVTLVPSWPAGPKTVTYTITDGLASAVVPAGVPGVAAGTHLIGAAALQ